MRINAINSKNNPIDPNLLKILSCLIDGADLKYDESKKNLVCVQCRQKYKIENGIPVLLPPSFAKKII